MNASRTRRLLLPIIFLLLFGLDSLCAYAQSSTGPILTLAQAEALAIQNHPRIAAASLRAQVAGQVVAEENSAYYPSVGANLTGTLVADIGTAIAAGNLTTSSISNRLAGGGNLLQMVTDFGRTNARVRSARFQKDAMELSSADTRAQIILGVRQAYYSVLSSEATLSAVQETLKNRQLTLRQVTFEAQGLLKSTLDVSFAQVLESEAELALLQSENEVRESRATLAASIGETTTVTASLVDQSQLPSLSPDLEQLIKQAEDQRPDLRAVEMKAQSAEENAEAEKRLGLPTVNFLAAAGELPEHDRTLKDNYAAVGFNVSLPLFTGGLFAARRSAAQLNAHAAQEDLRNVQLEVARQVRFAWLEANDAFRRLALTSQLVQQANEAMRLAQARYDNGLSGIVELNEAQLNQTSAQISSVTARYEYLIRSTTLDYQLGVLP